MEIGKKIKQRRNELGITQETLAEKINVSRSTVSNWEIGRNYPDIQTIVSLSDELDISLDELLKEDKVVVKKITEDTQVRNKNKWAIRILLVLVVLLSVFTVWNYNGQPGRVQTITSEDQIKYTSFKKANEGYLLDVEVTELPAYRSLSLYSLGEDEDNDTLILSLSTDFDFRNQEALQITISDSFVGTAESIQFVDEQDIPYYKMNISK